MEAKTKLALPRIVQVYSCLCLCRICNALLLQTQFDPDEYWQNLEPAYCKVFQNGEDCQGLTWEWKRRSQLEYDSTLATFITMGLEGPVRSYVSILPTYLYYMFLKRFGLDTTWMVSRGPLVVNAILVSATADLATWLAAHQFETDDSMVTNLPWWCLICAVGSWFNGYAMVRTYSNATETMSLVCSIALVSPELLGKMADTKVPKQHQRWRSSLAFFLGGMSAAVRFTALAAWIPMGIMLSLQQQNLSVGSVFAYLFKCCATFGMLGLVVATLIDRSMFGFWAMPFLGNFHFNVLQGLNELYGTHVFHWYFSAGVPAITGLLLPFLVYDCFTIWTRGRRNLWIIVISYTMLHSFSPHKEFRFILPMLPLFCLLAGKHVASFFRSKKRRYLLVVAGIANLVAVLYLGVFHQRAAIDVNKAITDIARVRPGRYHVHYMMGCHSAPLMSHLHTPPSKFYTKTLDCSPECRLDSNVECESDQFHHGPAQFMQDLYFRCSASEPETCGSDQSVLTSAPDFLVTMSTNLVEIEPMLETMGLVEHGRYVHGIEGIGITTNDAKQDGGEAYFGGMKAELSIEYMVLFVSENIALSLS